jgi:esterase/lipase superfamily enzyme
MAFIDSSGFKIINDGGLLHSSFDEVTDILGSVTKLTAYDGAASDYYGYSVAVGSGRIVIGAYGDDGFKGSVYVYDLDGNLITKLTAYDGAGYDYHGRSVAVGSNRIVIGAYRDDNYLGSAYVYDLDGNLITKLTAYDRAASDYYGRSVAVGSGRIVIGSYYDDDKGFDSGSAYVYDLDGNLITKLTAFDGASADYYGYSVAVGSGRIVIGSYLDDDLGSNSGSAYVYDLDGNLITKLTAYDGAVDDYYGASVAVGSGRIVIGAWRDDDKGTDSGSAYVYDLDGNLITKLTAFDGADDDRYGFLVSVGSGRIVIGAYQDDDLGSNSGSTYVYDLDGNLITKLTAYDGALNDYYGGSASVGSGRIVIGVYSDDDLGSNSGSAYIYELPETYDTHFERIICK